MAAFEVIEERFELFPELVIIVQRAGPVVSRHLKLVQKYSQKTILRGEISRVESDGREGEVLQTLRLYGGGDVLGVPVPHSLHQEHRGRGEGPRHQDGPDDPSQCSQLSLVENQRGSTLIGRDSS